jgi:farnesyl-diphosphate farnesyltransferase
MINVCLFYLILRALDSIEDDMNLPKDFKIKLLKEFLNKNYEPGWKISGVGDKKEYVELLENYDKIVHVFLTINQENQLIITDICRKMGAGMAHFVENEIDTVKNYNLYCHHVAGLVGVGLSKMFLASGLEKNDFLNQEEISSSMGLFLQKTNIVRDYKEDLEENRIFWPKEIWRTYASKFSEFSTNPLHEQSISCLNHMVNDALSHVIDCLEYLRHLSNENIFKFCAIPQVMAMATLCKVYNNHEVFIKNVKIRKGLAAKLILNTTSMDDVIKVYKNLLKNIENKIPLGGSTSAETRRLVKNIRAYCNNEILVVGKTA